MKKMFYLVFTIVITIFLYSCSTNESYDVVTTMYPQYDIANQIVQDKLSVKLLVSPGVEYHDFQPSSKQAVIAAKSKLFIFTSYDFDNWLNNNVSSIINKDSKYLDLSTLFDDDHSHEHEHVHDQENDHEHGDEHEHENDNDHHHNHEHDHDHGSHFWTNPINFMIMIDAIKDEIIKIDPVNKEFYSNNALNYKNKINDVVNEMNDFFELKERVIYFAGHNALEPLSEQFNFTIKALSETNKPDAEITDNQIIKLYKEVKNNNVHYLFIEELKEPKVAKIIQKELAKDNYKLDLLELHGYHNISHSDYKNKISYYDILVNNFNNIKIASENL